MFSRRQLILLVALCLSVAVISAPTPETNDPVMIREVDTDNFERREPAFKIKGIKPKTGGSSGGVDTKSGSSTPKDGDTKKPPPSTHTTLSKVKANPTSSKIPSASASASATATPSKSHSASASATPTAGGTCLASNSKTIPKSSSTKKIYTRAIDWFFGRAYDNDVHSLVARAAQRKTGDKITLNGNTFTLGTQHSGASRGSGDTATFEVTYNDQKAIAKQQTTIKPATFSTEIQNTKAAGDAQGNGLYLDAGCDSTGTMWMIMKKVDGLDIINQLIALKTATKPECENFFKMAAKTAAKAQGNLAAKAHFTQGDENYENYLFTPDFETVNIIDFGVVSPVGVNAKADQIEASQEKAMRAQGGTFSNEWIGYFLQPQGLCKEVEEP